MNEQQRETLSRWTDLVFKVGTPLGFLGLFYLKSTFATHDEVAAVAASVYDMKTTITILVEQNKTNERQDKRIDDFEMRIRALERFNR
jgi:hypothetical protein